MKGTGPGFQNPVPPTCSPRGRVASGSPHHPNTTRTRPVCNRDRRRRGPGNPYPCAPPAANAASAYPRNYERKRQCQE